MLDASETCCLQRDKDGAQNNRWARIKEPLGGTTGFSEGLCAEPDCIR
jgi:hypothetical protein